MEQLSPLRIRPVEIKSEWTTARRSGRTIHLLQKPAECSKAQGKTHICQTKADVGHQPATAKPANIVEKMLEGKMAKFYEEVCLYQQPFIKEQSITIEQLIASVIGKLGENISVRRFARFKVGDVGETIAISKPQAAAAEGDGK